MRVADIMRSASMSECADDSLKVAATRMWSYQTGSLLVSQNGVLAGIFTERDIMEAMARGLDLSTTTIGEVMTVDLLTVAPHTGLAEAAREMAARFIRHLPVLEGEELVGMVSQRDLVGVLAALLPRPGGAELSSDELVRQRRLVPILPGDLD